jgi:hypothetical protein
MLAIQDLLSLHDKFMSVVNQQFERNSLFHKALKEAFVEFVNKDVGRYKNADLMSSFCDRILKKGGEKLSDEEVEDNLEKVSATGTGHDPSRPEESLSVLVISAWARIHNAGLSRLGGWESGILARADGWSGWWALRSDWV